MSRDFSQFLVRGSHPLFNTLLQKVMQLLPGLRQTHAGDGPSRGGPVVFHGNRLGPATLLPHLSDPTHIFAGRTISGVGNLPLEFSPMSSPSDHTIASRSPPTPHMCGYATARTRLVAIAASAALPPSRRTFRPISEARVSGEQTAACSKCATG